MSTTFENRKERAIAIVLRTLELDNSGATIAQLKRWFPGEAIHLAIASLLKEGKIQVRVVVVSGSGSSTRKARQYFL